jgi:phosphoglycolate phosphatase
MLYLFDIDGTLVDTGGAGLAALEQTTLEIFGEVGPPLDLAGATDLGIVSAIHDHFRVDVTREGIAAYLGLYEQKLDWFLQHGGYPGRALDGALTLLEELSSRRHVALGLLTGNTAVGAATKVRHYGLASYFAFGAYGCDDADRNRLGPIALERACMHSGRRFTPEETWIIGDTPKDIACARAIGARCLAVATGRYTIEELETFGPDRVAASLDQATGWI